MAGLQSYPVLEGVARCLEEYRWAAWLLDRDLNVVWISPEFQDIVGSSAERLCGRHFIEAALSEEVRSIVTERSLFRAGAELIPFYVRFTPGGRQGVKALLKAQLGAGAEDIVDEIPDDEPGPVIGSSLNVRLTEGMEPVHANFLGVQLRSADGALIGHMIMFVGTLPFRFLPLLARGDEATLARTVRLATPGHRQAAILFADLQSSGTLSSRLPSELYFRLVRDLVAAFDQSVTDREGIVGRHAGDGVTAFFIVDDTRTPSRAARSAFDAARAIEFAAAQIGARYEAETHGLVLPKNVIVNIGLHWGNALYMGQLVSNGRLEVTALGDPVNECARIQETASDGQMLASKQLLENLSGEDAAAVDVRPAALAYRKLSAVPGATAKAIRDAGGVSVAVL